MNQVLIRHITGAYSYKVEKKYSDENNAIWEYTFEGTKEGKASIYFSFKGQKTSSVLINVTKNGKSVKTTTSPNLTAEEADEEEGIQINTDILSDDFLQDFNPENPGGDVISQPFIDVIILVVNNVLVILQIIGAVVFVLSLAAAGVNGILATNEGVAEDLGLAIGEKETEYRVRTGVAQPLDKGALQKIIRRSIIGSIFMFTSSTIVRIVFNIIRSI